MRSDCFFVFRVRKNIRRNSSDTADGELSAVNGALNSGINQQFLVKKAHIMYDKFGR